MMFDLAAWRRKLDEFAADPSRMAAVRQAVEDGLIAGNRIDEASVNHSTWGPLVQIEEHK
jgi:hypothetical protein